MYSKETITYYKWIFFTGLLPYIGGLIPAVSLESLGFRWDGVAWTTMLVVSLFRLLKNINAITMPSLIWLPWIIYIVGQWIVDRSFYGLQSTLQYMVFPVVGMTASTFSYSDETLIKLKKWLLYYATIIIAGVWLFITHISLALAGATTSMTIVVLCTLLLSDYWLFKNKTALFLFCLLAAFPVAGLTRMGILMLLTVLALHFGNKNNLAKITMICVAAAFAVLIFYSEGFQKKTFYSGSGEIEQFSFDSKDLNTNGRNRFWQLAEKGVAAQPWLGSGSRADLKMLTDHGLKVTELHNDYLAVLYNYGMVGLACLLFGFTAQFWLLYKQKKVIQDAYTALFYYAALTIFITWVGFMYSDNALKYAVFYGNFHFCIIGIVYSRIAVQGNKLSNVLNYDNSRYSIIQQSEAN